MKLPESALDDDKRWQVNVGSYSRINLLKKRQQALIAIRDDLNSQDFIEVETPLLVKHTCPDAYIDSIQVGDAYLITSTEYQIKRLITGGFEKVFTLTKNFRANDRGRHHSIEFTMLEWARANQTLSMIEQDAMRFIQKAFRKLHPKQDCLEFNGHNIHFMAKEWKHLTVREAFEKHLGISSLEDFSLPCLLDAADEAGLILPAPFKQDKSLLISYLLDLLQSHLGKDCPTFLHEWPADLTSSAPASFNDPHAVERSELYIGGIEIANGFPFLRNEKMQRDLFLKELEKRKELGKPLVSLDEKYLEALQKLPSGAGMALGIDRLLMVLTGSNRICDVQSFDWDEL